MVGPKRRVQDKFEPRKRAKHACPGNPFEMTSATSKDQILGRRVKGVGERQPGKSRSRAVQKRREVLLSEWKRTVGARDGEFDDRRLVAAGSHAEDSALLRFRKERGRRSGGRASIFQLGEENDGELKHLGASLSSDGKIVVNSGYSDDEDSRGDYISAPFGSGTVERSQREIMQEVVSKSKMYKAERQMEREEQRRVTDELDEAFRDMSALLDMSGPNREGSASEEVDRFDKTALELSLQAKHAATQRSKTEDEIARETREKLEQMEKERLQRMVDQSVKSSGLQSAEAEPDLESLNPDYEVDPEFVLESSEDEDVDEDDIILIDSESAAPKTVLAVSEMSYTPGIPETVDDLEVLLSLRTPDEMRTIIGRIRAYNPKCLSNESGQQLQKFLAYLVQAFGNTAARLPECASDHARAENVLRLDVLTEACYDVGKEFPRYLCAIAGQRLDVMRRYVGYGMIRQQRNLSSCFPDIRHLLEVSLFMRIFPGTDLKHPFVTPFYLTVGQILSSVAVSSPRDVVSGLILCDLVITCIGDSHRYLSEVIGFLSRLYQCAAIVDMEEQHQQFSSISFSPAWSMAMFATGKSTFVLNDLWCDLSCDADFSCRAFRTFCSIMERVIAAYVSCPSLSEIMCLFPGIVDVLAKSGSHSAAELSASICELVNATNTRKFLKRAIRPKMIQQFDPKFDENFVPGKDLDPDRSKADLRKLKRKLKSETKGARRELRRDAAYIEQERRRELTKQEALRETKRKEVLTFLQQQQRDSNLMSKVSKKRRK